MNAFTLWLEFEEFAEKDSPLEYFNMTIALDDGTRYALNVWCADSIHSIMQHSAEVSEALRGQYAIAPDLIVAVADREHLEQVVAELLERGLLKDSWRTKLASQPADES